MLLEATTVEVTVADRTFVPPSDVVVDGDPGTPNEYTTLELTWHEHGVEQRIYIYFTSDGTNWWADEIRTYDGNIAAEWIEEHGVFFESPLGSAFVGDLDLPNLKIHGMRLEAFRPLTGVVAANQADVVAVPSRRSRPKRWSARKPKRNSTRSPTQRCPERAVRRTSRRDGLPGRA